MKEIYYFLFEFVDHHETFINSRENKGFFLILMNDKVLVIIEKREFLQRNP